MRVIHFEINADEPERAVRFYSEVFGWKIHKWDGPADYWLVETGPCEGPGINGGIGRRQSEGQPRCVNTVGVASVDEFTAKITTSGGTVVMPKMPIPGVGYLAYCQDPDGNTFGIMQSDPAAA